MLLENEIIISKPILTEKSNRERIDKKKYYFQVHVDANKVQVKIALENLFGVKVKSCNIMNIKGKKYRTRKQKLYYKAKRKKAIISLKEDSTDFEFYENI